MAKFSNWFHRQEELLEKAIAGLFYDPENFAKNKEMQITPELARELLSSHRERAAKEQHATASIDAAVLERA